MTGDLIEARRRSAFTIVELAAVMALLAILTSAVAMTLRPSLDQARQNAFVRRIGALDSRLRDQARRQNRLLVLAIDIEEGEVFHEDSDGKTRAIRLGNSVRIDQFRMADKSVDAGQVRISISPLGRSDSYALRLRGSSGRKQWLVVFGLTGQTLTFDEDLDADEALSIARA